MEKMAERGVLAVLVGPPGCGKTTEANRLATTYGYSVVCPDEIRKELYGDESVQGDSEEVFALAFERTRKLLEHTGVIFDATSCRRQYREQLLDAVYGYCTMAIAMVTTATLEECLANNSRRFRQVPEGVIKSMYKSLKREPPTYSEGFDVIMRFGKGSADSKVRYSSKAVTS